MRIRFKALSPSDEDLSKTRPEGPSARQRASERAPKAEPKTDPKSPVNRSGSRPSAAPGRPARREETAKIAVVEPKLPEPKRKDPRRE